MSPVLSWRGRQWTAVSSLSCYLGTSPCNNSLEMLLCLETCQCPGARNTTAATSLRNFGNSVYPGLPVTFGGDTKSCRSLLFGIYARGSKRSHQSALEMCNLSWTVLDTTTSAEYCIIIGDLCKLSDMITVIQKNKRQSTRTCHDQRNNR